MDETEVPSILVVPQCFLCRHYARARTCVAYPNESIPFEIIQNRFRHTKSYPGDNGIRFEPKNL